MKSDCIENITEVSKISLNLEYIDNKNHIDILIISYVFISYVKWYLNEL